MASSFGRIGYEAGVAAFAAQKSPNAPVLFPGRIDPNLSPPETGWVRFSPIGRDEPSLDILTTGEPTIPEAETGWEDIERPQRISAKVWRGTSGLRQEVPIRMDVLAFPNEDVEEEWAALVKMWRPAGGKQPPKLRVHGPVSRSDLPWVIVDLLPDHDFTKRRGNRLVRAAAVVVLEQYVNPSLADYADPEAAKNKALVDRPRFELSKQGDTIKDIAKRALDSGRKWTEIRKQYPGADAPLWTHNPERVIPTNTQVRLPNG